MRLSWSSMQSFLTCQRKYELHYVEGLSKPPSADSYNTTLGSAFHAGIQSAISHVFLNSKVNQVKVARDGVRKYIEDNTINDKKRYNYEARAYEYDTDYYQMLRDAEFVALEMIDAYLPTIGLGSRYIPVNKGMVLQYPNHITEDVDPNGCAVEWKFEYNLTDEDTLTGIIDTVLWDEQKEKYVLVDWKTRKGFPEHDLAMVDGQLPLYAAVLNAMGANISDVIMWQFLTATPRPASISKVNSRPNMGAASYNTTWEVWKATLPAGLKAEHYEAEIRPKLKQWEDFQQKVESIVTEESSKLALENVHAVLSAMRYSVEILQPEFGMPAVLGSNACKFCDFLRLCANPLRYGGDATHLIEREYVRKEVEVEV